MKKWKKASFTVEASFLVPVGLTITILLLGFCFYTHQINWCKGVSYEALSLGTARIRGDSDKAAVMQERLDSRIKEIPVRTGEVNAQAVSGYRMSVQVNGSVLPDVFQGLFDFRTEASVTRFEPVRLKQAAHLLKQFTGDENAD